MSSRRVARADAVRNRARILDAARTQITELGPGAGMDQIAAAAGVAVGTLYRHFPTKAELVAAVIDEHVTRVADDAEEALERVRTGSTGSGELKRFLQRVVERSANDRAVKAAAAALGARVTHAAAEARATAALRELILSSQTDGDIHPDITVEDLYLLFTSAPTDRPAADMARWLELVLPGLNRSARPTS